MSCERDLELFSAPELLPMFKGVYTVLSEEATDIFSCTMLMLLWRVAQNASVTELYWSLHIKVSEPII